MSTVKTEHERRVDQICDLIRDIQTPISIGFSGGKDSSAVVKLLWSCALQLRSECPPLKVVYCDTEVENPIIDAHVKSTLGKIQSEAQQAGINLQCKVIKPSTHQAFFVRIIGRGYPTPTNSFRWCTKDIRIRPFQAYLKSSNTPPLVAIGTRFGESAQRDRSLRKHSEENAASAFIQRQREGSKETQLLTPIIDYDTADVWDLLCEFDGPKSIDVTALSKLYKDGSGECPAIRDFKDKPCSKARFGCWTCTVVRRDRSAEHMIESGYEELRPYFELRSWLSEFRNDPKNRCTSRRNGRVGPGPFTVAARHEILERVLNLEARVGRQIISEVQMREIRRLIESDLGDPEYVVSDSSLKDPYSFPLFEKNAESWAV